MVLWLVAGSLVTLLVAYIVYTIVTSYGSEYKDTSFEAFIDDTVSSDSDPGLIKNAKFKSDATKTYDQPGRQILIIYGTEYGFSKELARELYEKIDAYALGESDAAPLQPRNVDAKNFASIDLMQESCVFVIISTAGNGVPPSSAVKFVDWLLESQLTLNHLKYSVLALGDSNYIHFCQAGKTVDQRLQELGAQCIVKRTDVDSEDAEAIHQWFSAVMKSLDCIDIETKFDYLKLPDSDSANSIGPSRERPFSSTLKTKYNLTSNSKPGDKETIHCEFDVTDSGIVWTSGDALGIYPANDPETVERFLKVIKCSENVLVPVPRWSHWPETGDALTVRTVLQHFYDMKNVKVDLLTLLQRHTISASSDSKSKLESLLKDGVGRTNLALQEYLREREVTDVIEDFEDLTSTVDVTDLLAQMKALLPRYYSISSSPLVDPNTVCVTAAVVRYQTLGKERGGVTTTFLQDRFSVGDRCPVFISSNLEFRLPADPMVPVIMIGPGTGLAPFRAFIQERVMLSATGRNLLYFGCRQKQQDFLYKEELENWVTMGKLKLRTAFSRDQLEKVYVQDLIREDGLGIWELVSSGAHVYVCGDARHMAHDVHRALCDIAMKFGGKTADEEAEKYFVELEKNGRYQKDTWVS